MAESTEDKLNALVGRVRKVRRWLAALAILKVAATCLLFVSAYVGVYAWLDHRLNFGGVGRVTALVLLLAGLGLLVYGLTLRMLSQVSCSGAASYIENRRSFHQQLVTAMEYYENKQHYPYSKALAEQLVLRVDKDCSGFDFDSTVEKWRGYVLGAIILFGLAAVSYYVRDNYLYFSAYFARLARPLASVAPLPSTVPEPIREDIVAGPMPEVESMTAEVALPTNPAAREWVKPYTEQIESQTLEVIPRSNVGITVQATEKLREVAITGLDGGTVTKQLNGAKEFSYHFNADRNGAIKFELVSEQGLVNENLPDLAVVVKTDEPPKFKLICPDGDYLATNVASVPIMFEITDDFGLDSARICLEIPGYQSKELFIPVQEGVRSVEYGHTIELEEYELNVGDSILFHAEATDVDTGSAQAKETSSSEVYFIEIRPYRQNWRPPQGGGPGQGGMPPPVELLNILEYTRAIVKKTWAVAAKPYLTEQDRTMLDSIYNDVRYCAEQLAIIRDDPEHGFTDAQEAAINAILGHYEQAGRFLADHNANGAIGPAKDAYRLLRKFILELDLERNPPSSGQASQPERPDSVKMREQPEFSEYEKERIEDQIKKVQQELKKLTQEQKNLKTTFENLLKQQAEQESPAQQTGSERSSAASGKQGQQGQQGTQQGQADDGQKEVKGSSSGADAIEKQNRGERQLASESKSPGADKGDPNNQALLDEQRSAEGGRSSGGQTGNRGQDGKQGETGERAQSGGQRSSADAEARLRMFQAKQRALQEQVAKLKRDLQVLPQTSEDEPGQGRAEAQKHMDEAIARMDDLQEKLAEARYQADTGQKESEKAIALMETARGEMVLAAEALDGELTLSEEERLARQAQKMAEQLAEDADALDESVTPEQEQDMLARLEAAKRLLEMMPEPQWTTMDQREGTQSSPALVLTRGPELTAAEAARQLARQFWSISIEAKRRRHQLSQDEPSDVRFYGQVNEFFENAARFDEESTRK